MRIKILSVSTVFPNPVEPQQGLFVRHRLLHLAEHADIIVIAPVPAVDYGNPKRKLFANWAVPRRRRDGNLTVLHPRWVYPPLGGAANAPFLAARLLPLLERHRDCDVIDAHWAHPAGTAVALATRAIRRPFVVTLRGNEIEHAAKPLRRMTIAWGLRRANAVVCLSERLRRFAVGCGADPKRVRTIPNGVDAAVFHPRDRAACRRELGIPADVPVILSAGQLIELKGHHRILAAMRDVAGANGAAWLVIAGGAGRHRQHESEIRRQIDALGASERVRLCGQIPQERLAELMCAADVFCLASSREGWPNVVQEALACGTPVVATDVGAVPDMIPSDDYGYVVPPGDQDALRQALQKALNRTWDRERISRLGRSRSWEQVALQVLEEMTRIADTAGRSPKS